MRILNNNKIIILSTIILIIGIGIGIFVSYLINKNKFQLTQVIEKQTIENENSNNQSDNDFEKRKKCFSYQKEVCEYIAQGDKLGFCEAFYSKNLNSCLVAYEREMDSFITYDIIVDFLQGYKEIYSCGISHIGEDWHYTDSNGYDKHANFPIGSCRQLLQTEKEKLINGY